MRTCLNNLDKFKISFIVVSKNKIEIDKKFSFRKNLEFKTELILAIGENPSEQRNEAAKIAQGEWLYFLDDDSDLSIESVYSFLKSANEFPNAEIIGGPSLLKNPHTGFEFAIQRVFESDIGIGPLKSRYQSTGQVRHSNEKELILCNLCIKRNFFIKAGGFNKAFYPCEENEFLQRVSKITTPIYNPSQVVLRNHRENIFLFSKQIFNYGRGRMRQIKFSKKIEDLIYLIPLFYFFTLAISYVFKLEIFYQELFLYLGFIFVNGLIQAVVNKKMITFIYFTLSVFVCHASYALGTFVGIIETTSKPNNITTIHTF